MIALLAAAILIGVLIFDAWKLQPPEGEFKVHTAWWVWVGSAVLIFLGAVSVITHQLVDYPPSVDAKTLLVAGITARILCVRAGLYSLLVREP